MICIRGSGLLGAKQVSTGGLHCHLCSDAVPSSQGCTRARCLGRAAGPRLPWGTVREEKCCGNAFRSIPTARCHQQPGGWAAGVTPHAFYLFLTVKLFMLPCKYPCTFATNNSVLIPSKCHHFAESLFVFAMAPYPPGKAFSI